MALFERSSTLAASLNNAQRGNGCVPYDPNAKAPTYGYDPNLYVFSDFMCHPLSLFVERGTFLRQCTPQRCSEARDRRRKSNTDANITMQRSWHRLYSRFLHLNAGAHRASRHEPQMVVFRSRTGGFWYALYTRTEWTKCAKALLQANALVGQGELVPITVHTTRLYSLSRSPSSSSVCITVKSPFWVQQANVYSTVFL